MKRLLFLLSMTLLFIFSCSAQGEGPVSGTLKGGLRHLPANSSGGTLDFTVYRGDYIVFETDGTVREFSVPDLQIDDTVPRPESEKPYFKMKEAGVFSFTLGERQGTITVLEMTEPQYKELSAADAAELIKQSEPFILDVRTEGEYRGGHLSGAALLPVQVLSENLDKLEEYKDRDILIYCASGNRSTVASRILIDAGYNRIYNLRYGYGDWVRKGYPVE